MRAIFALALAATACAVTPAQKYPLPLNVGETHNDVTLTSAEIAKPQTLQAIAQPFRSESIDPEIFAILFAAHQREVDEARIAQENASDPGVRKLADMIVLDHRQALEREVALAQSLDMTSWDTSISNRLRHDAKRKVERINKLHGLNFDGQYLDIAIKQHAEVLRIIDEKLMPNVGSRELKQSLETDRENVVLHLNEARELLRKIK